MLKEQFEKLDHCYYDFKIDSRCEELYIDASELIKPERFDLYAILLYIDHKVKGVNTQYAKSVYKERTRTMTGYRLSEPENPLKNSFDDFLNVLDNLIEDFKNGNFDVERTLIPVDKNNVLLDGAHRTSVAAYFRKKVKILKFLDIDYTHVTSDFLREAVIPEKTLDAMALESVNWHDDLYMLFLWPKAFLQPKVLKQAISKIEKETNIVFRKRTKLSYNAIRNLMIQIYGHMDWIGSIEDDFSTTYVKADQVWDQNCMCYFFLIEAPSCDYVLKLKSEIRDMFGIELASMHSTDNMRETRIAANAIYNPNSLHFLNYGKPTRFKKSYRILERYKKVLKQSKAIMDDYIVDSSMVLSMYGIRSAADLDYLTIAGNDCLHDCSDIEEHDDTQKVYYDNDIKSLVLSPDNYFLFNELKFVSINKLLEFKRRRFENNHDNKDKNDIVLIEQITDKKNNKIYGWYSIISIMTQRQIRNFKRIAYGTRNKILISLHIYEPLRQFKKKYK